jgi:Sec-independent protein translocase protein TatA
MFDIAGSELLLTAAVALIVLGPEELLPLLRKTGRIIGKLQAQVNHWRWQLHNESIIESGVGIDPRLQPTPPTTETAPTAPTATETKPPTP